MPIILCFDTETTGKPPLSVEGKFKTEGFFNDSRVSAESWPRIVQLAFIKYDTDSLVILDKYDEIIKMKPGFHIPHESTKIHGITNSMSYKSNVSIEDALLRFIDVYNECDFVVGHNIQYDINVVCAELTLLLREMSKNRDLIEKTLRSLLYDKERKFCTMQNAKRICKLPKLVYDVEKGEYYKDASGHFVIDDMTGNQITRNPRLEVAHKIIFMQKPNGKLHSAMVDVAVCLRIFMYLYSNVDVCGADYRKQNSFIYKTIRPSLILSNELPIQIGDSPEVMEIKQMHEIVFGNSDSFTRCKITRSKTRVLREKTESLNYTIKSCNY